MTAPTTHRQALELLEGLRDRAESAAAARLEQMHGHLSVGHRASGYDGTAAQIHAQYAQALAPIVQALRAQAEAAAGEIESLRQEHEALRLASDASDGPIRRLRNRIYDLVSQLEARQQADLYTPVIRQQVEELRGRATQHRTARAALAQAGGESQ